MSSSSIACSDDHMMNVLPQCESVYGSGDKRVTSPSDGILGVSKKLVCTLNHRCSGKFVLTVGNSQLRTFTTGRVWCPLDWNVLSNPGGKFRHCITEITESLRNGFLDASSVGSIVLMPGTNELSEFKPLCWKRDLEDLLLLCKSRFPDVSILVVGPVPRLDNLPVPVLIRVMEQVCSEFHQKYNHVRFVDFGALFNPSRTELWAWNDQVHLSCNAGLPLLRDSIVAELNKPKIKVAQGLGLILPDYTSDKIRRHLRGSIDIPRWIRQYDARLYIFEKKNISLKTLVFPKKCSLSRKQGARRDAFSASECSWSRIIPPTSENPSLSVCEEMTLLEARVRLPDKRLNLHGRPRCNSTSSKSPKWHPLKKVAKPPTKNKIYCEKPKCTECEKKTGYPFLYHFLSKHSSLRSFPKTDKKFGPPIQSKLGSHHKFSLSEVLTASSPMSPLPAIDGDVLHQGSAAVDLSERLPEFSSVQSFHTVNGYGAPGSSFTKYFHHEQKAQHIIPSASENLDYNISQRQLMLSNDIESNPGPMTCKICKNKFPKGAFCNKCLYRNDQDDPSTVTASPQNLQSSTEIDFNIITNTHDINCINISVSDENETNWDIQEGPSSPIYKSIVQHDGISAHSEKKSRGRKRKCGKTKNLGIFSQSSQSLTQKQIFSQNELDLHVSAAKHRIQIQEVLTDVHDSRCLEGWYFKNSRDVQIKYTLDGDFHNHIQLNHLRKFGFSLPDRTRKILLKITLDKLVLDASAATMGEHSIQIKNIESDDENCDTSIESEKCTYYDSAKVYIYYTVDGQNEHRMRLNDLLRRGFEIHEKNISKFYSFLQLKMELRKYCHIHRVQYQDAFNNKTAFEEALLSVHEYYRMNPDTAIKENIDKGRGPSDFDEREDLEKLYYYGRGKIKYYRWSDMEKTIQNEYGQTVLAKFSIDPSGDTISEEAFERFLSDISKDITHNAKRNRVDLHEEYVGPQCYEDRTNLEKLKYNVLYRESNRKQTVLPASPVTHIVDKSSELKETVSNCSFSIRTCQSCNKIRVVGQRAAEKYMLSSYKYGGTTKRLKITCDRFVKLTCDTPSDLTPLNREVIEMNKTYIAYSRKNMHSFWGFILETKQVNENNYFEVDVKKIFGQRDESIFDTSNHGIHWMKGMSFEKYIIGTLNNRGRFIPGLNDVQFEISILENDPREAKCSQPFHDTNMHTNDFQNIYTDPDNIESRLIFSSLIAVKNIHSVLDNVKILHCIKCNKQCSGFENPDEITILENGKMEKLSQRNDADLYNAVHSSKMIKEIDLTLSKKFRGSNIYKQITDKSVSSICTNCERFYELDENLDVVHIDAQNEIVQSQDSQQNSQNSLDDFGTQNQGKQPALQLNQINPLGPENLFSLNIVNDHQFELFVSRLTRAEVMCISPLLLCISVLRCRATQIPFSKGGSIAYPLLNPMETKTLPWFDFKNMPIIIVYRDDPNEKYRSEAKVNLNNIIIVKEWMETLITYQGIQRTQNRLVGELFFQFDNDNFRKLKEQLNNESNKYVIPKGIRELKIAEEDEKEPLTKELVSNWLKSNFHYGKAVLFGLYNDLSEDVKNDKSISPLDEFWTELEEFSYELLKSKIKMLQLSSNKTNETQLYQEWINAGTVVTADTIARYAENMNYLNKVESVDTYDTSYFIFEEFQIMKTNFTNDLGLNQIDTGGTIDYCEDHPDTIVERNLQDTKLDRRLLQADRNNPAPEWENSYLQLACPDIFLTGDAAFDQKRPVPLFTYKSEKKCREEYIKLLALQKGVQDKPHFLFLLLNLLKKEDANQAAACILREVDLTTIILPTEDALRNEVIEKKSNMLLQYTPLIRDSDQFWKKQQKEAEALKRDMEYMDPVSRPGTTPIYASLFRTMAPPYNGIPSIHKLFTDDLTQLNNPTKRKQQALIHPTDVEWVISFLAELDVLYFRKIRYKSEWFVARNEHGANGNPHWHSVLFSQDYGKLIWRLKTDIEKKFEKMLTDRSSTGQFADQEINDMQNQIMLSFKKSQEKIIDFFRGSYSNWNPAFTSDGKLADETYGTSDISNLSLASLIDDALMTGDFSQLDKLYCDIVLTCCRHITHTGKNGLPSKKDYCYKESSKVDKEKSTKEKTVYKIKSVCKRRKPQPVRSKPAIYQDPHDKKFVQLSFESNDGNFNGADPFLILNNLGNADCKALIPSIFMKCPKIVISEDRLSAKLVFYHHDSDDGCTYVLKYGLKPAIKAKPDNKILAEVIERYTYRNPDDQNAQNAENDPNILKPKMIRAMYNQVAVQHHVCLFQAQHVNINLPQILKNYHVENVNCLGRRTLKKNANDSNSSDSNNELYNTTKIKEFDERKNITDKSQTKLGRENVAIINAPLSLRTKHDLFKYEIDLNTGKYKVKIRNRINPTTLAYNAIGFTPHTTMGQARPNGKQFPTFCKKMCLTNSKYDQIETTVRQGLEEKRQELGLQVPAEDQAVQDEYWVDELQLRIDVLITLNFKRSIFECQIRNIIA